MRKSNDVLASVAAAVAFCLGLFVFGQAPAHAQTCAFRMPDIDFGNIDLTTGSTFDVTLNLQVRCSGTPNARIRYCPNIGSGSGGHLNGDPRYMVNGSNQLGFNIFRNNGRTRVWGSHFWPYFNPPQPRIRLDGAGQFTGTQTIRARIYSGQTTLPSGVYTSSFSGGHTLFSYAYFSGQNCATIGAANAVQVPFTVRANNIGGCSVAANNLGFGTLSTLTTNADATSTVNVRCSTGTSYQVGLNGGLTGAIDPTQRRMAAGADQITYGLYQDAARAVPWGNTLGSNTVSGVGTGAAQGLTVFGRIPPQVTPPSATYADTIVVTVTY